EAQTQSIAALYTFGEDLLQLSRAGQGTFYHRIPLTDPLGAVRLLVDETGSVSDSYTYDAWGNVTARTGTTVNPYKFQGEWQEENTGLVYLRARWYDSAVGRFLSVDPWVGRNGSPITLHDYQFANADPIDGRDPSGWTTSAELGAGSSGMGILNTIAVPNIARVGFKKLGCGFIQMAADEAINYGIYILTDGLGNLYVGQSNDITRRYFEHLEGSRKRFRAMVAAFPVERLTGQAGRDLLRLAEQYVMDALKDAGQTLANDRSAIDKKRGRLRKDFLKFCR
ncbi:MAG: hypothetical protein F9K47_12240, partial [Burkholderiales bacterium]